MYNATVETIPKCPLDRTLLARNPAFLTSDDAAAYLHGFEFEANTEVLWYILKNNQGQYFCAEFVDAKATQSNEKSPDSAAEVSTPLIVTTCARNKLCAPTGYVIEASFHLHPLVRHTIWESNSERNIRNRFFAVSDLWNVIRSDRQYSRCYLSTDGGLLSYTSTSSVFEQELTRIIRKSADGSAQAFQDRYDKGGIPASAWILLAIGAGEVAIVLKGAMWFSRGALKASWKNEIDPQQRTKNPPVELMPICGPVLQDVTSVANYLRMQQQQCSSHGQAVGIVLKHLTRDEYLVTAADFSDYASFDRAVIFPKDIHGNPLLPDGFRVRGFYHSIKPSPPDRLPAQDVELYKNFYSPADLKVGLTRLIAAPHQQLFLITPDGAVLRFRRPDVLASSLIAELDHDFEQNLISGTITAQMFVDKVVAAGQLRVLLPSKTWPVAGKVGLSAAVESENTDSAQ